MHRLAILVLVGTLAGCTDRPQLTFIGASSMNPSHLYDHWSVSIDKAAPRAVSGSGENGSFRPGTLNAYGEAELDRSLRELEDGWDPGDYTCYDNLSSGCLHIALEDAGQPIQIQTVGGSGTGSLRRFLSQIVADGSSCTPRYVTLVGPKQIDCR